MNKQTYGYVCVSSMDQNEDRQLIAMQEAEVPQNHIYTDKITGKDFNRPLAPPSPGELRQSLQGLAGQKNDTP